MYFFLPAVCKIVFRLESSIIQLCFAVVLLVFSLLRLPPRPQFYWGVIDLQDCVSLMAATLCFDTRIYSKMIATIRLVNTSITPHSYLFFLFIYSFFLPRWWEYLTYFLRNFQVCNTGLLPLVTMLCIRSPELTHLITEVCTI